MSKSESGYFESSSRWLYIPVETKVREFDAKLLFALAAAEAGWRVVLGGQGELRRSLHRFAPGVYVDKSVTVNKHKWFRRCRALGHQVIAWDEEGLVYFDAETLKEMRLGTQSLNDVEMFFSWGNRQREAIREMCPEIDERVRVTGNPRFDMLRPELRSFYQEPVNRLVKEHGRFILVNTSFPFANHFLGEEAMYSMYARYPINERKPEFFKGWAAVQRGGLEAFRALIPELSRAFPDHTLIVRPHPSENHTSWQQWTRHLQQVKVCAVGPVVEWIAAADFMVHFDCTTGIEAFVMDAPAVSFDDGKVPGYRQPLPGALSHHAQTIEAVIEAGKGFLNHRIQPASKDSEKRRTAKQHIAALDGPLATDRIIAELSSLNIAPLRSGYVNRLRAVSAANLTIIRDIVQKRLRRKQRSYSSQKFPDTELAEVRDKAARLGRVLGRFEKVQVAECASNCFEISSRWD